MKVNDSGREGDLARGRVRRRLERSNERKAATEEKPMTENERTILQLWALRSNVWAEAECRLDEPRGRVRPPSFRRPLSRPMCLERSSRR